MAKTRHPAVPNFESLLLQQTADGIGNRFKAIKYHCSEAAMSATSDAGLEVLELALITFSKSQVLLRVYADAEVYLGIHQKCYL